MDIGFQQLENYLSNVPLTYNQIISEMGFTLDECKNALLCTKDSNEAAYFLWAKRTEPNVRENSPER